MPKKTTRLKPKKNSSHTRAAIKKIIQSALKDEFPYDTVDVSDGYGDNIHILVVSRKFDGLTEQKKQDMLWNIIDSTELPTAEKQLISLVLPLSPSEIK